MVDMTFWLTHNPYVPQDPTELLDPEQDDEAETGSTVSVESSRSVGVSCMWFDEWGSWACMAVLILAEAGRV